MIKRFFSSTELKILLDSFFFSVLYYNSEIWLLPTLKSGQKQQLLSASANALRLLNYQNNPYISFDDLHKNNNKSTPVHYSKYKLSLLLFKLFNSTTKSNEWIHLTNQIILTGRQTKFISSKCNNYKIGLNILTNRFHEISNRIDLDCFNLSFPNFKRQMKILFLIYN